MSRKLASRTRLDSLKKQAKAWLKSIRADDAAARSRLVRAWPDAPQAPVLRDLQHALALEYGLPDWRSLIAALEDLAIDHTSRAERTRVVLSHGWDGSVAAARRIIGRDPSIARENLFTAAACGDLEQLEHHLAADPQAASRIGGPRDWSALAYVTYSRLDAANAMEIARRLLEAGADPNFGFDDGWGSPFTVLTGAIGLGEGAKPSHAQAQDLVTLLVEAGAHPYDSQALYNISIVGEDTHWYEVLWRLCEERGETDRWRIRDAGTLGAFKQLTTLDYLLGNAVGQNHLLRARWLIDHGADPDTLHAYAGKPLHAMARFSGFSAMAALLERHGAKPVKLEGAAAFRAALLSGEETEVRRMVGQNPSLIAGPGPMLAAAAAGKTLAVRWLLDLGASPHGVDHDGISPLHRAVQSGSLETVDLLLAAGADLDLRERKWLGTAMSWSMVLGQPHISARLAAISCDVRALAGMGLVDRLQTVLARQAGLAAERLPVEDRPTPLFCLPDHEEGALEVAKILLAYGADPKICNSQGVTAVQYARLRGLDDAADLMEGTGANGALGGVGKPPYNPA